MSARLWLAAALAVLTPAAAVAQTRTQAAETRPVPSVAAGTWEGFMEDKGGDQFITLILHSKSKGGGGILQVLGQNIPVSEVVWTGERITARVGGLEDDITIEAERQREGLRGRLKQGANVQAFSLKTVPEYAPPADRVGKWTQDIEVLATRFIDLDLSFTAGERAMFLEALEDIRTSLPLLDDAQVTMRLAAAIALADNPHTRLLLLRNATELRRLPIRLWWFSDGLYVVRATPEYRQWLGCRVDDIEHVGVRAARDLVGRAFAGNPSWRDYMSVYSLTSPEALHGVGIARNMEQIGFGLSGCKAPARAAVRPLPLSRSERTVEAWWDLSPLRGNPHGASAHVLSPERLPLYLRKPSANYWFEHLADSNILYFQYNRSQPSDEESPKAFGERLLAQVEQRRPRAVVVDMRFNTGGDLGVARDMLRRLQEKAAGLPHYVITSRATFSAGISNVAGMRAQGPIIIVGEHAGDAIDHWSEGGYIRLPNSGFEVDFQTGFHSYSSGSCPPKVRCVDLNVASIAPDIAATASWADYIAGRDPSMEAVLADLRGRIRG